MRPRTVAEFIGQNHILGPGRLLRRAIQADQLSSVIFYGPPGTGKTTLARVIANTTSADFIALNAVLAGVKEIRSAVAKAQETQRLGRSTILFVDEVHRFNKAQQDALLPWVESGVVVLIGATTENPYFEVNKALVSRSRIFELTPLTEDDLRSVIAQALADTERGFGSRDVRLSDDALEHLVNVANGDARAALNALELAVETTPPGEDGSLDITLAVAEESIQRRAVLYDKEGDVHFDTISAFIKSVRGSDPDAALYWLAKMVYAGEDPRFILRRLLILASEDIGLADPSALGVATAAAHAFDYVGLPEGRFHLAQATLYLATAPKSNSTLGFFDALASVERERGGEVPHHLKDANRDAEGLGHGQGYAYPHAYRDHWVAQQYLPEPLQGKVFYKPSDVGFEQRLKSDVARRREAQLAAMWEAQDDSLSTATPLPLPNAAAGNASDRWLQRTISRSGERLARLRDQVFDLAQPTKHATILDLSGGTGLFTWEAIRRSPDGQTWSVTAEERTAAGLRQQAGELPALQRPVVLTTPLNDLVEAVADRFAELEAGATERGPASQVQDLSDAGSHQAFDAIVGRNVIAAATDLPALFHQLSQLLAAQGRLVLAEIDTTAAQRLYELVDLEGDPRLTGLRSRLIEAEEQIYRTATGDVAQQVVAAAEEAGLRKVRLVRSAISSRETLAARTLANWFEPGGERKSYSDHLSAAFRQDELESLRTSFFNQLLGREVEWTTIYYFLVAGGD